MVMNQDRLYQDFPRAVRCESSHTIVFVAIPDGARYGDVRKSLAGLLQRAYDEVNIAPPTTTSSVGCNNTPPIGTEAEPFNEDDYVPDTGEPILHAMILALNDNRVRVTE